MWSVINFTIDNTVEVVPSNWLKKNGQCAWPKTTNKKYILKAVLNKIMHNKADFNYFDARCLARNIGKNFRTITIILLLIINLGTCYDRIIFILPVGDCILYIYMNIYFNIIMYLPYVSRLI